MATQIILDFRSSVNYALSCRRELPSATADRLRKGVAKTPDSSGAFRRTRLAVCIGLGWRKHRPRQVDGPWVQENPCQSAELREVAETTRDQSARADLLALADRYDWPAAWAEDQERGKTELTVLPVGDRVGRAEDARDIGDGSFVEEADAHGGKSRASTGRVKAAPSAARFQHGQRSRGEPTIVPINLRTRNSSRQSIINATLNVSRISNF
jgi:hypothetical protein